METIIKRENGTQYKIEVSLITDGYGFNKNHYWDYNVTFREKGKKNWAQVPSQLNEYEFRQLSLEDRRKSVKQNYLRFVSENEILSVMEDYLKELKPTL